MKKRLMLVLGLSIISLLLVSCDEFAGKATAGSGSGGSGGGGTINPNPPEEVPELNLIEAESFLMSTSAKNLEMANSNNNPGQITGETLYDILTYISKDELNVLADGTYKTGESGYTYSQYLYFDVDNTNTNELVKFAESDDDIAADFFYVDSGKNIGKYKLEFSTSAESDSYSTAGSESTTGVVLQDFEDTTIKILGEEYTIVLARRPAPTPEDSIKLTLLGGVSKGTLNESEEETYWVGNTSYGIKLTYTDATYAEFIINGEITDKLQVGDTFKLKDGKEIGVSKILYQAYAEGIHRASFFIGANKIVLRDNDITDTATSHKVEVGGNIITGADVIIIGDDDNSTFKLTTIEVNMTAQDDYFVGEGGKLSDVIVSQGDHRELLFTNFWDIKYSRLTNEAAHDIKVYSPDGVQLYNLIWYDGDGNKVDMPLIHAGTKLIILKEKVLIKGGYSFIVTGGNMENGTAKSYALQYLEADASTATSPKIKFRNLGNEEILEYPINTGTDAVVTDIKLGGFTFKVESASDKTINNFDIYVDLDATYDPTYDSTTATAVGSLKEGEAGTYKIGENSYAVKLVYTDSTYAKFTVNGEDTDKLQEGEFYILTNGNEIKVTKILYQSYAGGVHSADFILTETPFKEGIVEGHGVLISDSYGAKIDVEKIDEKSIDVTLNTPKKDYEDIKPSEIKYRITTNNNTLKLSKVDSMLLVNGDSTPSDLHLGYTSYGSFIEFWDYLTKPGELTINYPEKQKLPQVYIIGYKEQEDYIEKNDSLSGIICPRYSQGSAVHKITPSTKQAALNNTYEDGWEFSFLITVPENEGDISVWIDDWNNSDTNSILKTEGNVKLKYDDQEYSIGSKHDYSKSGSFNVVDKYPSCSGLQLEFDVLVKLPEDTDYGSYTTSYGIKSK